MRSFKRCCPHAYSHVLYLIRLDYVSYAFLIQYMLNCGFVLFFRIPSPTLRSHDNWETSSQKLWISLLLSDATSYFECKVDTCYFYISIFKCEKFVLLVTLFLTVIPALHLYFYMNLLLLTFLWLKVKEIYTWCPWKCVKHVQMYNIIFVSFRAGKYTHNFETWFLSSWFLKRDMNLDIFAFAFFFKYLLQIH